jgi:uncharacterized membrane protein
MHAATWLPLCCAAALVAGCQEATAPSRDSGITEKRAIARSIAVTDLGTLGGSSSAAAAINPAGQVVARVAWPKATTHTRSCGTRAR